MDAVAVRRAVEAVGLPEKAVDTMVCPGLERPGPMQNLRGLEDLLGIVEAMAQAIHVPAGREPLCIIVKSEKQNWLGSVRPHAVACPSP